MLVCLSSKIFAMLFLACLLAVSVLATARANPPIPIWPDQFNSQFKVFVKDYGPDWSSTGAIYYNWVTKTFRGDYINWCLPLFDSGSSYNNYTCSFLATNGNMYFVNHTAKRWEDNQCCTFEKGLGAVPPDWVKSDQYNGTTFLRDEKIECDVWWSPGTMTDPANPCYAYWDARDKVNTPVQFFGLSALNETILEYTTFDVGHIPAHISLDPPNQSRCNEECKPPSKMSLEKPMPGRKRLKYPHYPVCE